MRGKSLGRRGAAATMLLLALTTEPAHGAMIGPTLNALSTPLRFEANQGQSDPQVHYLARTSEGALFLTPGEAVLAWQEREPAPVRFGTLPEPPRLGKSHLLRLRPVGGNPAPVMSGEETLPSRSHYLKGRDPAAWQGEVANHARVRYQAVYPGIDLAFHGHQGRLEYDFIVAPGADPDQIQVEFPGAEHARVDDQGRLLLTVDGEPVIQEAPLVYQEREGQRKIVAGGYRLLAPSPPRIAFTVAAHDPGLPLVIDPVLSFSTFLGGVSYDNAYGVAATASGETYAVGSSVSTNFPVASAYQSSRDKSYDATLTHYDADGDLVAATYFGGDGWDVAYDVVYDETADLIVVVGDTSSTDFPVVNAYDSALGGASDGFIAVFTDFSHAPVFSTYLGGSDDIDRLLAADVSTNAATERIYVGGFTLSSDLPTTAGALQASKPGGLFDGYMAVFDLSRSAHTATLGYLSYVGGSKDYDYVNGVAALDHTTATSDVLVAGVTSSTDLPTQNPYQGALGGGIYDAYLMRVNTATPSLVYATYLGGIGNDTATSVAADPSGYALLTGFTFSPNFPTKQAYDTSLGFSSDAFVAKLAPSGSLAPAATLVFSTYLGGGDDYDYGYAIDSDSDGNVYVAGYTYASDFPTAAAFQTALASSGPADAFIAMLASDGTSLEYASYLGGEGYDYAFDLDVDSSGAAHLAGYTYSEEFPTENPAQSSHASSSSTDAFVARVSAFDGNHSPVALNAAASTVRNTQLNSTVTATDEDGNTLSYSVVTSPSHGSVTITAGTGAYRYTPTSGYTGSDSFTFRAYDGSLYSNTATITLTVTSGPNTVPVANDASYSAGKNQSVSGSVTASDGDGNTLTYAVVSNPANGSVVLNSTTGAFNYTPTTGYLGTDSFTFKANDGYADSNTATITITVANSTPTASNGTNSTSKNHAVTGALAASDGDSDTLTYSVVSNPSHGTVSVTASSGAYTYTPTTGYVGSDTFTFKVNDGTIDSNTATITLTVTNATPTVSSASISTTKNVAKSGTLSGSDTDGDTLTYSVVTSPGHGTVSVTAATGAYTYTPTTGWSGTDTFTYKVNDGTVDSSTATITVTVSNTTPTASSASVSTNKNTAVAGTLSGSDADGDSLTFSVGTNPGHGSVTITATTGAYTYTPTTGWSGTDTFTYKVYDGSVYSSTATITITVSNNAPVASSASINVAKNTAKSGSVTATDGDGDTLTYSVVTSSMTGSTLTLTASTGAFTYTPKTNYTGTDSFTFRANDGTANSNTATISITVVNNTAPTASNGTLTAYQNIAATGTASASDADGNSLTYSVVSNPSHGTVSLTASTGAYTYTPTTGYTGADSFTFRVNDGYTNSGTATITITVNTNTAPVASSSSVNVTKNIAKSGTVTATDVNGQTLTYSVVSNPSHGTLSLTASTGAYTYTPTTNYTGADSFTFKANDGGLDSNTATVSITVATNTAPTASSASATVSKNSSYTGALTASDSNGDALTYSVVANPSHGTVSVTASTGAYTYTPTTGYTGADSFTFRVNDGTTNSNTATITLTVQGITESGGLVSWEAENYTASQAGSGAAAGQSWQSTTSYASYSGASAMQALANSGVTIGSDGSNGPRLDYDVTFATTGTYYVWVRMMGPTTNDDSLQLGVDGTMATTGNKGITSTDNTSFNWENDVPSRPGSDIVRITISTAGTHTINIWMREDGAVVDKVLLTTDSTYVPS